MADQDEKPKVYKPGQLSPLTDIPYEKEVTLVVQLVDTLFLHGALILCLTDPSIGKITKERARRLRAKFAEILRSEGFPEEYLDAWVEYLEVQAEP
jgi:hypothetical protein